jgi:hypothetical protein
MANQFIEHLKMVATGRKGIPRFSKPMSAKVSVAPYEGIGSAMSFDERQEYTISVEYRQTVMCLPEDMSRALDNATRHITHALYGDMYEELYSLEMALYDQDVEEMRTRINNLFTLAGRRG